jgi:hypothetical protein
MMLASSSFALTDFGAPRRMTNTTPQRVARLHATRQANVLRKPLNDRSKPLANV